MKEIKIFKNSMGEFYVNQRGKMVHIMSVQKKFWTIGEVAKEIHASTNTIRMWCEWFKVSYGRTKRGDRRFNYNEFCRLKVIHVLLRVEGHTVKGAQREMNLI